VLQTVFHKGGTISVFLGNCDWWFIICIRLYNSPLLTMSHFITIIKPLRHLLQEDSFLILWLPH